MVTVICPKLVCSNHGTRLKSLKLVLFQAPFLVFNQLPRVHPRLILLFFSLFLFFMLNFLGCAMTTAKVKIPTDEIVDSTNKLMATTKTLTFHIRRLDLVKQAPEGSFFKRLSRKNILAVSNIGDLTRMKTNGLHQHILLMEQNAMIYAMSLLSRNEIGTVAFIKQTTFYERLSSFHMRRSLDRIRKRFINNR